MLYRSGERGSPLRYSNNFHIYKNGRETMFCILHTCYPTFIFNFPFSNFNLKNFCSGIYTLALIRLSSQTGNGGSPSVLLTVIPKFRRSSAVFGLAGQDKRIYIRKTVFNRRLSDGDFFVSQIINSVFKTNTAKIL